VTKLSIGLLAIALSTANSYAQLKSTPLTGAWQITGATTAGPNGRATTKFPGVLIFTGKYYSRMLLASDQPRSPLKDQSTATAAELLAAWGPLTAASGTYEIVGDMLNLRPMIAKNPQVMAPGVIDAFTFKVEGNTLTMTAIRNANGPVANGTIFTYTRIE
jgi:Lipocalin-like domain